VQKSAPGTAILIKRKITVQSYFRKKAEWLRRQALNFFYGLTAFFKLPADTIDICCYRYMKWQYCTPAYFLDIPGKGKLNEMDY